MSTAYELEGALHDVEKENRLGTDKITLVFHMLRVLLQHEADKAADAALTEPKE